MNIIVPQFLILAIVFLFVYFPVFGRRRVLNEENRADFGVHIDSFGEYLMKTGNERFAVDRIKSYQTHIRNETGISFAPAKSQQDEIATATANPIAKKESHSIEQKKDSPADSQTDSPSDSEIDPK